MVTEIKYDGTRNHLELCEPVILNVFSAQRRNKKMWTRCLEKLLQEKRLKSLSNLVVPLTMKQFIILIHVSMPLSSTLRTPSLKIASECQK